MKKRIEAIINTCILAGLLIISNALIDKWTGYVDLTDDKRFTLSESTRDLIASVDETIYIKVLLGGELPSGFQRLEESTIDVLRQFRSINSNIEFLFENPTEGSVKEVNDRVEYLRKQGILPTNLMVMDQGQRSEKLIYPYALFSYGTRQTAANLLEEQNIKLGEEEVLNRSINLLEYKLANAIQKLVQKDRKTILFLEGHNELLPQQTARLERELALNYEIARVSLDSAYQIKQDVDLLIVSKPKSAFSEKDLFKIDQYVMNGGKIIWMVEKYDVALDSIAKYGEYVPRELQHGLENLFFDYGIRFKSNLVLDAEASKIPQVIGYSGDKPQTSLFKWYYHPIIKGNENHPISKNIGLVNVTFPTTIDTLKTASNIKRTILASSSDYSRFQVYPMRIGFDILKLDEDLSKFNKGPQSIAVLAEGQFKSHFSNRVSQTMLDGLRSIDMEFKESSIPTKQIFISDADFVKNLYDPNNNQISEIGYNKWENYAYPGNKQLIKNSIEFLLDDYGLLESRSKDVKLRLLDQSKIQEERTKWQLLNVALPIIILVIFGFVFQFFRRRKYE